MGDMRNEKYIQNFDGKSEGQIPLGRHRRIWENNIRIVLRKVGSEYVDRMRLAHDRDRLRPVLNTVMNPLGVGFLDLMNDD
jgi:hypothetical protein